MAWLHGSPKRHKNDESPKSRAELLDDDDPAKSLPEINGYLSKCFMLSGVCLSGGMAIAPLTWVEVDSFVNRSAYPLTGWESEQIILMSRAYVNYSHKAKDLGCPSPFNLAANDEDAKEINRAIVNARFTSMFNAMDNSK